LDGSQDCSIRKIRFRKSVRFLRFERPDYGNLNVWRRGRWRHASSFRSAALDATSEPLSASPNSPDNGRLLLFYSMHPTLSDDFVGSEQNRIWHCQPESLDGFQVDDKLDLCRALNWETSWLSATEDLGHENSTALIPCG